MTFWTLLLSHSVSGSAFLQVDAHISSSFFMLHVSRAKGVHWKKDILFNKWWWKIWFSPCQRVKGESCLSTYTKLISKGVMDLNFKLEKLIILELNLVRNLEDPGECRLFVVNSNWNLLIRITNWQLILFKRFCPGKSHLLNGKATYLVEKCLNLLSPDKRHISIMYEKL